MIDKLPIGMLKVGFQEDYGKVWCCHVKGFPNIAVLDSVGTKRHAQTICDFYNHKFKKSL